MLHRGRRGGGRRRWEGGCPATLLRWLDKIGKLHMTGEEVWTRGWHGGMHFFFFFLQHTRCDVCMYLQGILAIVIGSKWGITGRSPFGISPFKTF